MKNKKNWLHECCLQCVDEVNKPFKSSKLMVRFLNPKYCIHLSNLHFFTVALDKLGKNLQGVDDCRASLICKMKKRLIALSQLQQTPVGRCDT